MHVKGFEFRETASCADGRAMGMELPNQTSDYYAVQDTEARDLKLVAVVKQALFVGCREYCHLKDSWKNA
ncbi:hypothetical protein AKJ16_DCAP13546 [Drosera capensis]